MSKPAVTAAVGECDGCGGPAGAWRVRLVAKSVTLCDGCALAVGRGFKALVAERKAAKPPFDPGTVKYVPTALRPPEHARRRVTYACGYEEGEGLYGMWAGPFPDLKDALEEVPSDRSLPAAVIKFNADGSDEVVYKWEGGYWMCV